jgi:anaerobic selenocysteine-containing dehydrogenase
VQRRVAEGGSPVAGRDPEELLAALAPRVGPERLLDLMLRCGPYGDAFGARDGGLTLAALEAAPHGVDFGPLRPRLPGALRTPSGRVELAPPELLAELPRLVATLDAAPERPLILIGRRELRTLNSWLHNLPNMAGGPRRCTLHMHPDDAATAGVADGDRVCVRSRAGALEVPVELTDAVMPGVVSMPHGWGHEDDRTRQAIAVREPGVNMNVLTDRALLDATSGTAALNGVPVEVVPVPAAAPAGPPSAW